MQDHISEAVKGMLWLMVSGILYAANSLFGYLITVPMQTIGFIATTFSAFMAGIYYGILIYQKLFKKGKNDRRKSIGRS